MTENKNGTTNKLRKNEGLNMRYSIIIGLIIALMIFWLAPTKSIVNMKNAISPGSSHDSSIEVIQMQAERINVPPPPEKNINIDPNAKDEVTTIPNTSGTDLGKPPVDPTQPPGDFVFMEEVPKVISRVIPEFPEMARQKNITGKVYVRAWIDVNGNVVDAKIVKSDNPMFDTPAIEAAKKTKFSPAKANNQPVAVWFGLVYTFEMN